MGDLQPHSGALFGVRANGYGLNVPCAFLHIGMHGHGLEWWLKWQQGVTVWTSQKTDPYNVWHINCWGQPFHSFLLWSASLAFSCDHPCSSCRCCSRELCTPAPDAARRQGFTGRVEGQIQEQYALTISLPVACRMLDGWSRWTGVSRHVGASADPSVVPTDRGQLSVADVQGETCSRQSVSCKTIKYKGAAFHGMVPISRFPAEHTLRGAAHACMLAMQDKTAVGGPTWDCVRSVKAVASKLRSMSTGALRCAPVTAHAVPSLYRANPGPFAGRSAVAGLLCVLFVCRGPSVLE